MWSGYGNLTWNGQTWTGTGTLGSIANLAQVSDLSAQSVTLLLSGIPNELVSDCISTANQNNSVKIWLGFLDPTTNAVISTPTMIFNGHTDVPTITCGALTSSITISCENPLICLNLASNRVYSNDDQWQDYPTDIGFTFVPAIQDWNGNWGTAGGTNPPASGTGAAGPGTGTLIGTSAGLGSRGLPGRK